jgi:hypothetical protein
MPRSSRSDARTLVDKLDSAGTRRFHRRRSRFLTVETGTRAHRRRLTQLTSRPQRPAISCCDSPRPCNCLWALPDAALVGVREGRLSSRVVAPLARANAEHADRLLQGLSGAPLSTRELRRWFEHYQGASRATRERLVSHPQLFLQDDSAEQRASDRLREGPEGECEADLRCLDGIIARLRKRLSTLRPLPEVWSTRFRGFR